MRRHAAARVPKPFPAAAIPLAAFIPLAFAACETEPTDPYGPLADIVSAASAGPACHRPSASSDADAGGTMFQTVGDTTIARSGPVGLWGAPAALVPEVSVGKLDGPDEELFGSIASIAAGADLSVYILDRQAQHIRVFDSAGAYVETLGGPGEGPGELEDAFAIAMLPTGRLVARDPANLRLQTYGPGPGETDEWRLPYGGWSTTGPLSTDALGRTYLRLPGEDGSWSDIVVFDAEGAVLDTLPTPSSDFETPFLVGGTESHGIRVAVPSWPGFRWTVHSSGGFLTGLATEYKIELERQDGILRIERDHEPVPVTSADRRWQTDHIERMMRPRWPDWTWDGPPIPDNQPAFLGFSTGRSGRIWVRLPTVPRFAPDPDHDPDDPTSSPLARLAPTCYDVFEPDGTYLGAVDAPEGFATYPQPVFDGDLVWGVERDQIGIERVVRYRIEVDG